MDLKSFRSRKRVTQQRLASDLGVSRSTVAMWENGSNEPDSAMLINLARYFSVSVDELLSYTPESLPHSASPSLLIDQLCAAYNLNDKARAMIEMIIAMPPNECEIIAELAQRYASLLNHKEPEDENEPFRRAADQLTNDKKNDGITKARA